MVIEGPLKTVTVTGVRESGLVVADGASTGWIDLLNLHWGNESVRPSHGGLHRASVAAVPSRLRRARFAPMTTRRRGERSTMARPEVVTAKAPREKPTPSAASPVIVIDVTATELAWKAVEPRVRAFSRGDVGPASLDVTQAASVAIAATRNVLSRRTQLEATFHAPPFARLEGVIQIAQAAQHADLLHRVSQDKTALFADLYPRMTELRGLFLDDLDIQVKRGKCTAKFVADLRLGDRDAADFANDLNDAAAWYVPRLTEGLRTTISIDEVTEARSLAATALARLATKLVVDATAADALSTSELRARAFTLLAREYDLVRQYGAFLFWSTPEGWEAYVPSLWVGRSEGGVVKAPPTPPPPAPAGPRPPTE
jgi:hypothetical protein